MVPGIGMKMQAYSELIRLDLAFGAGFFLVAGEIFALGEMPPLHLVVWGFLALFFISGSANISNDYFDREVDRINLPLRPLPSGRVSVHELFCLFFICSALGLFAASRLSLPVFVLSVFFWILAFLYNLKLKEYGLLGNLVVATCVGMTVILGGLAAGTINGVVLVFGLLAFFFDLGEEIAADTVDCKGDEVRSSQSLAGRFGREPALRLFALCFIVFFAISLVPFVTKWLGYDYLVMTTALGLFMLWCAVSLIRSPEPDDGRIWIRRLYLGWGFFVIVIVLITLL